MPAVRGLVFGWADALYIVLLIHFQCRNWSTYIRYLIKPLFGWPDNCDTTQTSDVIDRVKHVHIDENTWQDMIINYNPLHSYKCSLNCSANSADRGILPAIGLGLLETAEWGCHENNRVSGLLSCSLLSWSVIPESRGPSSRLSFRLARLSTLVSCGVFSIDTWQPKKKPRAIMRLDRCGQS